MAGLNEFAKRDRHERRWRGGGRLDDRNRPSRALLAALLWAASR